MNKLIKLSNEHYIIIDNSEILNGDYWIYICPINGIDYGDNNNPLVKNNLDSSWFKKLHDKDNYYKVTYSTLFYPGTIPLKLNYIEEIVSDVFTYDLFKQIDGSCEENEYEHYLFKSGFKAHKKLTEDKLFTNNDLIDFAEKCLTVANNTDNMYRLRRFVIDQAKSLKPKTEWNIEIVDNEIKLLEDEKL